MTTYEPGITKIINGKLYNTASAKILGRATMEISKEEAMQKYPDIDPRNMTKTITVITTLYESREKKITHVEEMWKEDTYNITSPHFLTEMIYTTDGQGFPDMEIDHRLVPLSMSESNEWIRKHYGKKDDDKWITRWAQDVKTVNAEKKSDSPYTMVCHIGYPAMLEQTAEECTELAKACLKMSRILRSENPTPVSLEEAYKSVIEEYTDIIQCAENLDLKADREQMEEKRKRFSKRVEKENRRD